MDYHMTDIIPLLPIPQPPYGKVSYNIPCPKCQSGSQHRKGRLNINLKKDVFRCPKCGQFEGGVFDLYAYYMGISRDDVHKNASVVTDRLVPVRRANEHIGNFHHRLIYRRLSWQTLRRAIASTLHCSIT